MFRTAGGELIQNQGERVVKGYTQDNLPVGMRYAVTDVQVLLDSISQICDTGTTVTFASQGGTITGAAYAVDFERRGDTYVRTTWVKVPMPLARRPFQN